MAKLLSRRRFLGDIADRLALRGNGAVIGVGVSGNPAYGCGGLFACNNPAMAAGSTERGGRWAWWWLGAPLR